MVVHFEALWEKCENFFKDISPDTKAQAILEELAFKFSLYKAIDSKEDIPEDERKKVKSRVLGEILLTLTHLSLKDNVDVYEALAIALQYRSIEHYNQKHPQP